MSYKHLLLLAGMVIAIAACDADSGPGTGGAGQLSRCEAASDGLLTAIEMGLTVRGGGSLSNGYTVKSTDFDNVSFVAAQINGEGLDDSVGVWATNDIARGGSIFAAEALAAEFSDWGDGPGFSPSDDGLSEARSCAEG
jgi:hypothetical protein